MCWVASPARGRCCFPCGIAFSLLTLCASLAVLTLCKDAGLLYALAGVAAAYACLRTQGSEPALARGNAARRALWPLACVAAARLTWSAYATVMGAAAQATFSDPVSLSVLLSPEGAWRRTTLRNFLYKFFEAIVPVGDSDMSISYFLAFVLIGAGFALLYGAVRESKQALRLQTHGLGGLCRDGPVHRWDGTYICIQVL